MNGAIVQNRIYAGYAKTAQMTGRDYAVYRSDTSLFPADSGNLLATIPMSFARDKNFAVPNKYLNATWLCWADGRLLQTRDILIGPYGTFYIGDMQPLLPMQAIKCNKTVKVGSVAYSVTGDITTETDFYAEGVPAFFQFTREDIQKPLGPATLQLGRAITHWNVFIPLANGTLKQDDIMEDEDGIRYTVDAPDFTNLGYVARVRLATV